jgi:hypothetical protein
MGDVQQMAAWPPANQWIAFPGPRPSYALVAMTLQYVAIGSMIIMAGVAAAQVLKDAFGSPDRDRGRSK